MIVQNRQILNLIKSPLPSKNCSDTDSSQKPNVPIDDAVTLGNFGKEGQQIYNDSRTNLTNHVQNVYNINNSSNSAVLPYITVKFVEMQDYKQHCKKVYPLFEIYAQNNNWDLRKKLTNEQIERASHNMILWDPEAIHDTRIVAGLKLAAAGIEEVYG